MSLLELRHVHHAYDGHVVLANLSFGLHAGTIGCLLGPSGCGKTTALRVIAGFEPIMRGEILIEGEVVTGRGRTVAPDRRGIGMVFQEYALFPHLTVADNIAFGLARRTRNERDARVRELLGLIGLPDAGGRYPHELSGGQQQRIALARALAPRPRLLLLDEPFSNLDVEIRERLSIEVRGILKREGVTAILVTHDQHEAFAMADVIGVMNRGRIEQWDSPYNLYHTPESRFVADFVGQGVLVPGTVLNSHQVEIELGILNGEIPVECDERGCAQCSRGCRVEVLLRPDDVVHDDSSELVAEVEYKAFRGAEFLYTLRLPGGGRVLSLVPSHHDHALGEKIGIKLAVDHVVAFRKT